MPFAYAAFDTQGKPMTGVIDAGSPNEAGEQLHARGLFVTELAEQSAGEAEAAKKTRLTLPTGRPGNTRDLLLFAQQITMMLRAGSRIVPAMEAIESQINKVAWRKIVLDIRQQVETGTPLSGALALYPDIFNETWRAIISAGESAGQIDRAFEQLATMTKLQQQVRVRVIGALVYPAVLLAMACGLMGVLIFFVLPRFSDLYAMLNTPLPILTRWMLAVSGWATKHLIMVAALALALGAAPVLIWRIKAVKIWFDALLMRLPLIGKIARQIILAKVFRIWGTSICNGVPLLESLALSRNVTRNVLYRDLVDHVSESVSEGNSIGQCLRDSPLVPRTMASAVATGEQSGQLGEALLFLTGYLEDENTQSLATLTRLIEPLILMIMGATVGLVAVSLFLPLFDLTSAM